jgi:hypothetical protein
VNRGGRPRDAKASSLPRPAAGVGAAIVVCGWESQPHGEGRQSVGRTGAKVTGCQRGGSVAMNIGEMQRLLSLIRPRRTDRGKAGCGKSRTSGLGRGVGKRTCDGKSRWKTAVAVGNAPGSYSTRGGVSARLYRGDREGAVRPLRGAAVGQGRPRQRVPLVPVGDRPSLPTDLVPSLPPALGGVCVPISIGYLSAARPAPSTVGKTWPAGARTPCPDGDPRRRPLAQRL